ncbi:uncharacterized protein A4U43_C04F2120 [Asparagus officinalis]|uniref:Uncharacterized protein n=1 Tax=Asparagus officinalis TaxID=4686 RepID=A0A5P1EXL6_ASPOF|nr:uncharacterized protein A4U43_C04F2120 [Asparagus officinalis]
MASTPPPSPGFCTPSGSLPMSPLSPMNQRAAATAELMLAGDESRFMGQSRIDRSLMSRPQRGQARRRHNGLAAATTARFSYPLGQLADVPVVAHEPEEVDEGIVSAVGMEVDDNDALDFLSELERPPLDADFFNSFEDDFDDADIN